MSKTDIVVSGVLIVLAIGVALAGLALKAFIVVKVAQLMGVL